MFGVPHDPETTHTHAARPQVNYDGDEEPYATIPPGHEWTVDTFEVGARGIVPHRLGPSGTPSRYAALTSASQATVPEIYPGCCKFRADCYPTPPQRASPNLACVSERPSDAPLALP